MSIQVMTLVWQYSQHKGGDLLTLLAIADHADDHGVAYPSIDRLAQKTRMQRRNTIYVLHRLEKSNELKIEHNSGPGGVHSYKINIALFKHAGANIAHANIAHANIAHVQNADGILHPNHQEPSSSSSGSSKKKNPSKKKRAAVLGKTAFPSHFQISDTMRKWGETRFPHINLDTTTEQWIDACKAKDYRYKDWESAWRNGIRKAVEWGSAVKKKIDWSKIDE